MQRSTPTGLADAKSDESGSASGGSSSSDGSTSDSDHEEGAARRRILARRRESSDTVESSVSLKVLQVDVVEESHEWAGAGSTSSSSGSGSEQSFAGLNMGRRTRYKNMALAIEAAEHELREPAPLSTSWLMPISGLLIFTALNLRLLSCLGVIGCTTFLGSSPVCDPATITIMKAHEKRTVDWWFYPLLASDLIFMVLQTVCALRDREMSLLRQELRSKRRWCSLSLVHLYSVLILGVLSGWQIVRSIRQLRDSRYRDNFLVELSDLVVVNDDSMRMPFFSSHLVFILEVPFVFRTIHVFHKMFDGPPLLDNTIRTGLILNCLLVVTALLAFDFNVSRHLRQWYSQRSFWKAGLVHCVFRSAEFLGSVLAVATAWLNPVHRPWDMWFWPPIFFFTLGLAKVAALCVANGVLTKKVWFLSFPFFAADLALFVDTAEVAPDARRLSFMLDFINVCGFLGASLLYVWQLHSLRFTAHRHFTYQQRLFVSFIVMIACAAACLIIRLCSTMRPPRPCRDEQSAVQDMSVAEQPVLRTQTTRAGDKVFGSMRDGEYSYQSGGGLAAFLYTSGIGDQLVATLEVLSEGRGDMRLSRLRKLGKLGEGGFGAVYRVQDTRSGSLYALKLQRHGRAARCAIREAKALHSASHAFIVQIIHIFQTTAFYSILMELCHCDLNTCILRHVDGTGLPFEQTQHYTICMMLALEYLHDREIVFRDLKPENVLTTAPQTGIGRAGLSHAKLADFGLARSLHSESGFEEGGNAGSLTTAIGTPAFMAAEAFDSSPGLGSPNRSRRYLVSRDWYALGCCLLLMVLGKRAGRVVSAGHRAVLLPLPLQEFRSAALAARRDPCNQGDPLGLSVALTEQAATCRAGPEEMRASPFLIDAIPEVEELARILSPSRRSTLSKDEARSPLPCCA